MQAKRRLRAMTTMPGHASLVRGTQTLSKGHALSRGASLLGVADSAEGNRDGRHRLHSLHASLLAIH
ncbi:hypothetical protein L249_3872 [Ophiocordyceps polyrhachis-furcata BCC 54312]|uniref:Uncharacterized protein n=1 Tax=Ophiocordyceps polyrhachis-furcata BCC 54312 TaxID=1330021 RepID=A0A367L5J4_9HYPO|nr:hypothetical protein L249_3835 [Ophiocordyceps polyrhachis-furcata BCC 54312]RCI09863.1 hypothetical protein L249_3872 [Ophiocordyceps polyrhachis-furcata BCC 54312]